MPSVQSLARTTDEASYPTAARLAPTPDLLPVNDFISADPSVVPQQGKTEGSDWFVLYNPAIPRIFNVSLAHTFRHDSIVACVRFSADGKWLATGSNQTAQIFDVQTGRKTCVLEHHSTVEAGDFYVRALRFSPDGKFLATGAEDGLIRIWDIAKRFIYIVFDGHQGAVYSLDFSPDGRLIVSSSENSAVRIWDMEDRSMRVLPVSVDPEPASTFSTISVAFSPDGTLVAAGCCDDVVWILSVATGVVLEQLRGHTDAVHSIVFTPDGNGILSGSMDNTLKYWDLRGGESRKEDGRASGCKTDFLGHKDFVLSVALSNDSQWIVSGSKDRSIQFWDGNGAIQCLIKGHKNSVISVDLNPVGNLLASGSGDMVARIWSYTKVAQHGPPLTPSIASI